MASIGRGNGRRRARGSALVEISLVAVLFFGIVIAIMDLARFLFCEQALVERARAAARWGAVTDPANTIAIKNVVLYSRSTVPAGGASYFGLTSDMVAVTTPDSGTDNYRLVVTISGYSFPLISPFLSGNFGGAPITVSMPLGRNN